MMKDKTLIPGQVNSCHDVHQSSTRPIQETETPGTGTVVAQPEDAPSLSQFNRPETDGPSSSNALSVQNSTKPTPERRGGERSQQAPLYVAGTSNVGKTGTGSGASNIKTPSNKEPIQTQEQDLLRREITSTPQVSIQAEQVSTSYSSLPDQQFISSPPSPLGPNITMPTEAAGKVNTGRPLEREATHLESQNLSHDMRHDTRGHPQSNSSKVIPPGDISGNLRQTSPGSSEETYLKQVTNEVTGTPTSDSGSTASTPIQSLDPYPGMSYQFPESLSLSSPKEEISEEPLTNSCLETTFINQLTSPPVTQISRKTVTQEIPATVKLSSNTASKSNNSQSAGMSEAGDTLNSIGSMQNQSDLDLDHGSLPSGDGPLQTVTDSKSEKDETESLNKDQSESVRGANSVLSAGETISEKTNEESFVMDSRHNTGTVSLSSSTSPIEEKEEQLISDQKEPIPQKFSESGKSEVCHVSDEGQSSKDSLIETGDNKPEEGSNQQQEEKFGALSAPLANNLTNGKLRTRRASMSDVARPTLNFLGNWILKPALHVIGGADQLYI
ncbi:cell wall protein RBR3-like [Pecten maximus]|uniref:cell wall protein RBR3-like n=1 Tax=Pecten maximus TaxID=6579 RepID=UPI0014583817|nr:cell wall protein RBR3-like [Pecten maximus]